ncbi:DUF4124 domain-containing protein [Shewanella sedimentimangrovi]|uniref:DUF4124 domain-containing protein n=1 Tax=Shewanella sedimentimangrovi TaxID=2814293 RepID=A0ABX7R096_9GAMM|nr:DUF4124 domain-containing protein [Shewanella sedimentimangrovi]QSX36508.1 DUF4124 domain-containing protein [Shewanella sedimentimangrovi]
MVKLVTCILCLLPLAAQANTIYKCIKDDKVVFSQSVCPSEFKQHEISYQLGVTTEVDSDHAKMNDPLQALLSKHALSPEKLLQLLDSELYRLKQENSYYEILRASEMQKLERKRYWQEKREDDAQYLADKKELNDRFDALIKLNEDTMAELSLRRDLIAAETLPLQPRK